MARIYLNPSIAKDAAIGFGKCKENVSDVTHGVHSVHVRLDYRILNRNGINRTLQQTVTSLSKVEKDLQRIQKFIHTSVDKYESADRFLSRRSNDSLLKKLLQNEVPSKTYDIYNKTIGNYTGLVTSLTKVAGAGILHIFGIGLFSNSSNAVNRLYGKIRIPTADIIAKVTGNKWTNSIARFLVNKSTIFRHKDKSLADLIFRRYAGQYSSQILNYSQSITNAYSSINNALGKNGTGVFNAIKSNVGNMGKTALSLGRSNFVTGMIISGGIETVGAGIKITENYAKYEGDLSKLKTENAKVVGEAAFNTVAVSGSIALGAVIGGAIGTIGGPVGTYVGATVGSLFGGFIGDKVAKSLPGVKKLFTDAAVKHENLIFKGTEFVADSVQNVKNSFQNVKDNVSNLFKPLSLKFK